MTVDRANLHVCFGVQELATVNLTDFWQSRYPWTPGLSSEVIDLRGNADPELIFVTRNVPLRPARTTTRDPTSVHCDERNLQMRKKLFPLSDRAPGWCLVKPPESGSPYTSQHDSVIDFELHWGYGLHHSMHSVSMPGLPWSPLCYCQLQEGSSCWIPWLKE